MERLLIIQKWFIAVVTSNIPFLIFAFIKRSYQRILSHFLVKRIKWKDFIGGTVSYTLPLVLQLYFGIIALKVVWKCGPTILALD